MRNTAHSAKHDIIFIDFDETLFNHAAFNTWLDDRLTEEGLMEAGFIKRNMDAYHTVLSPVLRLYRHEEHLRDATGKPWSFISGHAKTKLRGKECQFCYSDSHEFLRRVSEKYKDVRILSFGTGEYQRFKMSLCRVIAELDIPIHIVNEPKSIFLGSHFSRLKSGILVDDKYPLDLPSNIRHILIDRKGHYLEESRGDKSILYVNNLESIEL